LGHGYFRSENITATNQQAWKRGNPTLKKRGKRTKREKLSSVVNDRDGHMHIYGASVARHMGLTNYRNIHIDFSSSQQMCGDWHQAFNQQTEFSVTATSNNKKTYPQCCD
jgi:hypothetical protein